MTTGETPGGELRPVGIVFMDSAGRIVLRPAKIERVSTGGRPKKTLRDVALTLHFEYLNGIEHWKKTAAYVELAGMFKIGGDPEKDVRPIIKRTRADILSQFPTIAICPGPPIGNRVMACLGRHADGTVEGYAVTWGSLKAHYGRGVLTSNPGGLPGFDLRLD